MPDPIAQRPTALAHPRPPDSPSPVPPRQTDQTQALAPPGARHLTAQVTATERQRLFAEMSEPALAEVSARAEASVQDSAVAYPPEWYAIKAGAEATCFAVDCRHALGVAKVVMPDDGLAEQMVDHFRNANTGPVFVDLNRELERNPQLREFIAGRIETLLAIRSDRGQAIEDASGSIWIAQGDYGSSDAAEDQRLALGGTFFEFQVLGSADDAGLLVGINIADHYFWSPSDVDRPTQCLHECSVQMVGDNRATEFYQYGEGQLVVADPRTSAAMPLLVSEAPRFE